MITVYIIYIISAVILLYFDVFDDIVFNFKYKDDMQYTPLWVSAYIPIINTIVVLLLLVYMLDNDEDENGDNDKFNFS